ncbi:MAG TPA: sigma-70 family RNA polymerase sigma factor [Solirubrobacterales bacterium]|nr:sigma-70 family RNA polymerase sigma factor [Solirubrobacterales bacterium]
MERPGAEPSARTSAAVALLAGHEPALRRSARRLSICADDADDAFQRAVVILLTKAPPGIGFARLAAWMHVVVRREALAVRRERERLLAPVTHGTVGTEAEGDRVDRLPCARPGPAERAERRERFEVAARLLAELKPAERLAIVLQACGYSYAEIGASCGWTYTKVNRSLAEGRARLRTAAGTERLASDPGNHRKMRRSTD